MPESPSGLEAEPTIDELKALQRERGISEHVVWVGPTRFVVAHTDAERATIDLEECGLHCWLHALSGPPWEPGYYVVVEHVPDAYSEPYGADPWDFEPLPGTADTRDEAA